MMTKTSPGEQDHATTKLVQDLVHIFQKLEELAEASAHATDGFTTKQAMQFGYNAGRLAELTGAGRAVWDSFKGFMEPGERWSYGPHGNLHEVIDKWMGIASLKLSDDEYYISRRLRFSPEEVAEIESGI